VVGGAAAQARGAASMVWAQHKRRSRAQNETRRAAATGFERRAAAE
jgi:hypothetical protein